MTDFGLPAIKNPDGSNNGGDFADTLGRLGFADVDGMPEVHDIVSLPVGVDGAGQYGHVAFVLDVRDKGVILVEDYNWADDERYQQHTISAAGCRFAHVKENAVNRSLKAALVRLAYIASLGRDPESEDVLLAWADGIKDDGSNADEIITGITDSAEGQAWLSHLRNPGSVDLAAVAKLTEADIAKRLTNR